MDTLWHWADGRHGNRDQDAERSANLPQLTWGEIKAYGLLNLKRMARFALLAVLACLALVALVRLAGWSYTTWQLAQARSHGVYPTVEEGMRQILGQSYIDITRLDIFYAGPDAHDGSRPYVWYATAEVRASRRADGTEMGRNGCDNPGMFFVQTKDGWVHVSEGAMYFGALGHWMQVFDLAGPGEATPSIDRIGNRPMQHCRSP